MCKILLFIVICTLCNSCIDNRRLLKGFEANQRHDGCKALSPKNTPKPVRDNFSLIDIAKMRHNLIKRLMLPKDLYIIGHRGMGYSNGAGNSTNEYPENTIESFKQAIILGADGIEFDVFETRDGHLVVIHDDALWMNTYYLLRNGSTLPQNETRDSFRVGNKDLVEIIAFPVGPNGQFPPSLSEVLRLIKEANLIRIKFHCKPLIVNIDIKTTTAALKCLDFITKGLKFREVSTPNFDNIYFTSSSLAVLNNLRRKARDNDIPAKIVPQITTNQIYGQTNVDKGFNVLDPLVYDKDFLNSLAEYVTPKMYVGIDCIVWDVNYPLIALCQKQKLQLHLYALNLKRCKNKKAFRDLIFYLTKTTSTYLKTDDLNEIFEMLEQGASLSNDRFPKFSYRLPLDKPRALSDHN